MNASLWLILLGLYVIGMVAIGFPMGFWSLRAWKDPEHNKQLGYLLFPFTSYLGSFGAKYYQPCAAPLMREMILNKGGHTILLNNYGEYPHLRARYIVATMLLWPNRFLSSLCTHLLFVVIASVHLAFENTFMILSEILLLCRCCTKT